MLAVGMMDRMCSWPGNQLSTNRQLPHIPIFQDKNHKIAGPFFRPLHFSRGPAGDVPLPSGLWLTDACALLGGATSPPPPSISEGIMRSRDSLEDVPLPSGLWLTDVRALLVGATPFASIKISDPHPEGPCVAPRDLPPFFVLVLPGNHRPPRPSDFIGDLSLLPSDHWSTDVGVQFANISPKTGQFTLSNRAPRMFTVLSSRSNQTLAPGTNRGLPNAPRLEFSTESDSS